jgi:hypothetical protein
MAKFSAKKAAGVNPMDIINGINTASGIVDATMPLLKALFDKINEALSNIGKNNPKSPAGRLLRIEALEAKDKVQKELNKLVEQRLTDLEAAK